MLTHLLHEGVEIVHFSQNNTNSRFFVLLQTYQGSLLILRMKLEKKETTPPLFATLLGILYQKYHGIREEHLLETTPGLVCQRITNILL